MGIDRNAIRQLPIFVCFSSHKLLQIGTTYTHHTRLNVAFLVEICKLSILLNIFEYSFLYQIHSFHVMRTHDRIDLQKCDFLLLGR